MEQNILKEELGISNDVNKIVTQIKSVIGDNYNKNKDNINKYVSLPNFQNSIFHNKIIIFNSKKRTNILEFLFKISSLDKIFNMS